MLNVYVLTDGNVVEANDNDNGKGNQFADRDYNLYLGGPLHIYAVYGNQQCWKYRKKWK